MKDIRCVIRSNAIFKWIKQTGKGRFKSKLIEEINYVQATNQHTFKKDMYSMNEQLTCANKRRKTTDDESVISEVSICFNSWCFNIKDEHELYCLSCLKQKRKCNYFESQKESEETCKSIIWSQRDVFTVCNVCNVSAICSVHSNQLRRCPGCNRVCCGLCSENKSWCERCEKQGCGKCLSRADDAYGAYKRCRSSCRCQYCKTDEQCICYQ